MHAIETQSMKSSNSTLFTSADRHACILYFLSAILVTYASAAINGEKYASTYTIRFSFRRAVSNNRVNMKYTPVVGTRTASDSFIVGLTFKYNFSFHCRLLKAEGLSTQVNLFAFLYKKFQINV